MKLYTIGDINKVCQGHGNYRNEIQIHRDSKDEFPPLFNSKSMAQMYLDSREFNVEKIVVEMEYFNY